MTKSVSFIQAQYQLVVASIVAKNGEPGSMDMVGQFTAPPGFRLHSHQPLKDTVLVGQPHKVLLVFEQVTQMTQEVPDDANVVEGETGDKH